MQYTLIREATGRKEIGLLVEHESYRQAKEFVLYLMKDLGLDHLRLKSTIKIDDSIIKSGNEEGIYGFEISYQTEEEEKVIHLVKQHEFIIHPIPMYQKDTIVVIHKPREQSELWMSGHLVTKGEKEYINQLAFQMEQLYEIEVTRKNLIEPSIVPVPANREVHKAASPVLTTSDLGEGFSLLVGYVRGEQLRETEFYYIVENEEYKFYAESQVKPSETTFPSWTVTWIDVDNGDTKHFTEPPTERDVIELWEKLKNEGQDMDYVNIFPPNSNITINDVKEMIK